ncbi:chemotaxis response regulator protein-glutamate methylesterase [Aquibacillus koreensis]|uniref:Protein-glutamate methylesterase/protein-glutamine glutaminase n=1 Tax=Aquibacillus koreensis TaxID=279446 RepID=A0A9X3WR75_9BACI|nr:chemotaxis response regulator protein-glutamate methylesterase [Aquibacillus koreensis]MCT2534542.1 chemotaxis response regulator protein-glutamate methylesterase [Aquibacillus koreensis]MDC3421864.1 chemotaxis response regulator protein-glutamate methylesterase [Aquibacillus koreensis]
MRLINVLVVDDSAFMRKMISDILHSEPSIRVIGTARNGSDALEKIKELKPDVITLDVEMPVMDGISTLKQIMKHHPLPVIMLSSLTKAGADKTMESIALGAVDFIAKPSGSISLDIKKVQKEIVQKVLEAANSKVQPSSLIKKNHKPIRSMRQQPGRISEQILVGIGTSTGGPRALQQVITRLPEDFPAPILVVQHMPQGFTKSLAQRLHSLSQITVKEAEHNEALHKGTAYIAPGGYQLRAVKRGTSLFAQVTKEEPRNGHQPSVDVLFESLAHLNTYQIHTIIMTGMGADGSKGIQYLKDRKSDTFIISESKNTAVVYGMPQAAAKTRLVDEVVDLHEISDVLINQIKSRGDKIWK